MLPLYRRRLESRSRSRKAPGTPRLLRQPEQQAPPPLEKLPVATQWRGERPLPPLSVEPGAEDIMAITPAIVMSGQPGILAAIVAISMIWMTTIRRITVLAGDASEPDLRTAISSSTRDLSPTETSIITTKDTVFQTMIMMTLTHTMRSRTKSAAATETLMIATADRPAGEMTLDEDFPSSDREGTMILVMILLMIPSLNTITVMNRVLQLGCGTDSY
jgi:hypothetical protein